MDGLKVLLKTTTPSLRARLATGFRYIDDDIRMNIETYREFLEVCEHLLYLKHLPHNNYENIRNKIITLEGVYDKLRFTEDSEIRGHCEPLVLELSEEIAKDILEYILAYDKFFRLLPKLRTNESIDTIIQSIRVEDCSKLRSMDLE